MQVVMYVHRSGEGLPDHAKVTEISQATAEAVRPTAHGALDSLINDIKAGWLPAVLSAADEKASADAAVTAAETALADAKKAQADADKALAAEKADADEDAKEAAAAAKAAAGQAPAKAPFTGPERRKATSPRRKTNTGNAAGPDRRTGPTDRRTARVP